MSDPMQTPRSILAWLTVRLTAGMTRDRFHVLMRTFRDPENVLGASCESIVRLRGFDAGLARAVASGSAADDAAREIDLLDRLGIRVITWDDPEYPHNLRDSDLAPPMLYVWGTLLPNDRCSVALVGSRRATQYGRAVARDLASGLARAGLTVVSGFARGVDSESHIAALHAGGRTLAILGCGLDVTYPSENQPLVQPVAQNGAMISEYPLGTKPERFNFPERNHVIAAISLGTVVVEAALKSGACITARHALEENRFVFAVPGDILRNNSRGTNRMIQEGARLVQDARDILVEMRHQLRGYVDAELLVEEEEASLGSGQKSPARKSAGKPPPEQPASPPQPSESPAPAAPHPESALPKRATRPGVSLKPDEELVAEMIRHEPSHFDTLATQCASSRITVQRLSAILLALELKGCIRQLPGRVYAVSGV